MKVCSTCGLEKPLDSFVKDKRKKDGHGSRCKECHNNVSQAYIRNNPEKRKETLANDVEGNRKRFAKWRANNQDVANQRISDWKKRNPEKNRLYVHNRRVKSIENGGSYTVEEWRNVCNLFDNRCVRCFSESPLTVDHVLPISKGGTNAIDNIQPLCMACNLKKHARFRDYRDVARILIAGMKMQQLYMLT